MINCKKSLILEIMSCFDFIKSLQNHCLFHQSPAKMVHILEISYKEIVYVGYQSWGKNNQLGVNLA